MILALATAAGLAIKEQRKSEIRFVPPYHEVTEQNVYRPNHRQPKSIDDLGRGIGEVGKG